MSSQNWREIGRGFLVTFLTLFFFLAALEMMPQALDWAGALLYIAICIAVWGWL